MVSKWQLRGKIISSAYRKKVLSKLNEKIMTPTELRKSLDIKMSHISRTLKELERMMLVESLTPELRKGKQYKITKEGKKILKLI